MEENPVEQHPDAAREARVRHVTFGAVLVAAGIILVLHHLDIFHVFALWPLLIVSVGISRIVGGCCAHTRREGAWVLMIGTWLLLNQLHVLRYGDSWPILLVAVGVLIVWDAISPSDRCPLCAEGHHAG